MSTVAYPHIDIRENGKAYIQGTGYKVRILVQEFLNGMRVEDMEREHVGLTRNHIYAALTYYYDHQEEMDRENEELKALEKQLREEYEKTPAAEKLRQAMKERRRQQ
jgi:uncharacterized protein (DUF433 family)